MADKESLRAKLAPYGQEHVLQFWDKLSDEQKQQLTTQIESINLDRVKSNFEAITAGDNSEAIDARMAPPPANMIGDSTHFPDTPDMAQWRDTGMRLISEGKVAALLLAGGQGTRLGSSSPKGMYPLGLPSGRTLFQLQAERIQRLQNLAKERLGKTCVIPWYIMTSGATMASTRKFLEDNKFFGLDAANVFLFEQHLIPSLALDGKLILETPSKLAMNPDGNGGLYEALSTSGALDDMTRRGIVHVHVYCVDNILVKVADPVFMGFCASKNVPAGALVVNKSSWDEKVGVVCLVDNKYQVVEYSEIKEATAKMTDDSGALKFKAGNIANHYFTVDFLKLAASKCHDLKLHKAIKAIPQATESGETVKPAEPNGIKIEKFVFDVFEFTDSLAILEVTREHAFSPLKNKSAPGQSCTAETCRRDFYSLCTTYLGHAGVKVVRADGSEVKPDNVTEADGVEITPLTSYAGEGLELIAKDHPQVKVPTTL